MDTEECYKSGLAIFHRVQEEFSELAMQIDEHAVDVAISVVIPTQSGLTFDMHLNLQNDDELHLEVGNKPFFTLGGNYDFYIIILYRNKYIQATL